MSYAREEALLQLELLGKSLLGKSGYSRDTCVFVCGGAGANNGGQWGGLEVGAKQPIVAVIFVMRCVRLGAATAYEIFLK